MPGLQAAGSQSSPWGMRWRWDPPGLCVCVCVCVCVRLCQLLCVVFSEWRIIYKQNTNAAFFKIITRKNTFTSTSRVPAWWNPLSWLWLQADKLWSRVLPFTKHISYSHCIYSVIVHCKDSCYHHKEACLGHTHAQHSSLIGAEFLSRILCELI